MIVCNTTPLISLAAIDSLELLNMLITEWCVPEAVYKEATISDKPFAENLAIFLEGKVKKVKNKAAVNDLRLFLDAGESEVIQLANELHSPFIVIDEKRGRSIAKQKGLNVVGTVGLLFKAKEKGFIDKVLPLIDEMKKNNIRLSKELITKVIEISGEN